MVRGSGRVYDDSRSAARWWVGFCDTDVAAWYHCFTRPGFRHCFAFRALTDNVLLIVNPLLHRVAATSLYGMPHEWIAKEQAEGARIVTLMTAPTLANPPRRGHIMTCASVIAYHMGLDTRAITPYGLYREIMRQGGREL